MSKTKRILLHLTITIVLVALGAMGFGALRASKPQLKKQKPPKPTPVVRTMKIKTGPQSVHILGEGTVKPLRSRFAAVRVRPAHRDDERSEPHAEQWLLIEWPRQET